jgi:formamidopyrimidine-DNA glycosylase
VPELPEVEVVRRGLEVGVVGRTVRCVEVSHSRAVRRHLAGADDFAAVLRGMTFGPAHRRGKFLWLPLEPGQALLAHLGMSGQLLLVDPGAPAEPHLHVRIGFTDDGPELRFVDQRTFGGLAVVPTVDDGSGGGEIPQPVMHIARDPLDAAFDEAAFGAAIRRRRTGLKRALLDQTLVSGVGNIYADEALWRARLHYARPTETLRRPEIARVVAGIREVFAAALAAGGTSFDSLYVAVNGESGYFERSLEVYGRESEPCRRCGSPIRRTAFMNRSSFWCPRCQPRPRRAHP